MKKLARLLSGLLVFGMAVPATGQVTDDDIDRARTEVNRIVDESAELGQAVIEAYGRQAALDQEIEDLRISIDFAQLQIAETEVRLEELAVELYMGSTSGTSLSVLFSSSDQGYPAGMEYLREVSGTDENVVDQLRVLRDELDRQTIRLGEALEEQEVLAGDLEELAIQLQDDLITAQAVYDQLVEQQRQEEEEARRLEEERRRQEEAARAAAALTTTTQAVTTSSTAPTTTTTSGRDSTTTTSAATTTTNVPLPSSGGACPVAGAGEPRDQVAAPTRGST
jgi:peptidoglycan hydrolase CwlO-like protein